MRQAARAYADLWFIFSIARLERYMSLLQSRPVNLCGCQHWCGFKLERLRQIVAFHDKTGDRPKQFRALLRSGRREKTAQDARIVKAGVKTTPVLSLGSE